MHPDHTGYVVELYAHCRKILVDRLSPEQLQLHDYFSSTDPLYEGDDCFDDFPLVDGLPEMLINNTEEDALDDDEIDQLAYIVAAPTDDEPT